MREKKVRNSTAEHSKSENQNHITGRGSMKHNYEVKKGREHENKPSQKN